MCHPEGHAGANKREDTGAVVTQEAGMATRAAARSPPMPDLDAQTAPRRPGMPGLNPVATMQDA
jgi:hypothetical protein